VNKEYITSERFIHDELLRRATDAVNKIFDLWKSDGQILPSILMWPADTVKTTEGEDHTGMIFGQLPDDAAQRPAYLREITERWKPYALLIVEQKGSTITALFESHHGTRAWHMSIERHGDARVLSDPVITDDTECANLLWSTSQSRA
jgi:hypothetical protein